MIHPELQRIIDARWASGKSANEIGVAGMRKLFDGLLSPKVIGPIPTIANVERFNIGHLNARAYTPNDVSLDGVILFLHGGGWVMGNMDQYDPFCHQLAQECGYTVVAIDYRLAPEHPFPAAVDDAFAALEWVGENYPGKLIVAGDSAGGNLAAVTTIMARDLKKPDIAGQVLIYPAVDLTLSFPSMKIKQSETLMTSQSVAWYRDTYCKEMTNFKTPLLSPYWANDHTNLPPALILIPEYDPLKDECKAYASKLAEAGNKVQCNLYDGMIHGFVQMGGLVPQANQALKEMARFIKKTVG